MTTQDVEFIYFTGTSRDIFPGVKATLEGSWNEQGFYSDSWTACDMEKTVSPEEGFCFRAKVQINHSQSGVEFKWGVRFYDPESGQSYWAIATELDSLHSRDRYLSFRFESDSTQTVQYFLTLARNLGANRVDLSDGTMGTRFRMWAPNALKAELVFGYIWDVDDPEKMPAGPENPIVTEKMAGGYIFDNDDGLHPAANVLSVPMVRLENGIWEAPADHPALKDRDLNHQLYMYRITRNDESVVYRTDIYSRWQIGQGYQDPQRLPGSLKWNQRVSSLSGRVSCSVVQDPEQIINTTEIPYWPVSSSDIITTEAFWADEFTGHKLPASVEDLIIYKVHIGALGFGSHKPGGIKDALALLDHISGLNVNAIELLPLSEFAGDARNWGYATSHYFAIEHLGGSADDLKHFVKACHRRGLAVIMDVVYNHYDHHAERAQRYYDSPFPGDDIYYWYEGKPEHYEYLREQWGSSWRRGGYLSNLSTGDVPAYHQQIVRKMFISSAVALVENFHIDGFRVDQTTSIHQYNQLRATGQTLVDANIFGAKFLRELGRTLRMVKPGILLIAEEQSGWDEVIRPVEEGGMGFDASWYSDYYQHLLGDNHSGDKAGLLKAAAEKPDDAPLAMSVFAGTLWETQFNKVISSESHDEAGNGSGPFLDEDWSASNESGKRYTSERTINVAVNSAPLLGVTRKYAEARCRFAWGVTALSAGTPMFLFGDEVGADQRFKYNAVLENKIDLHGLSVGTGKDLYHFYSEINKLRLQHAGLRSKFIDVVHTNDDHRVIAFRRWNKDESFVIFASLANQPYASGYTVYSIRIESGEWQEIFNSDSEIFGGNNVGNGGQSVHCENGRMKVVIPFAGVVVFKKKC